MVSRVQIPNPPPKFKEYAWVLVEVADYENASEWAAADVSDNVAISHSYSRGSYSASVTYTGDEPYKQGLSGTLALQALFSGISDVIYPDQPVSREGRLLLKLPIERKMAMEKTPGKILWHISVPIFKNTVILKQVGIAIGIPFGLVVLVIGFASGKGMYALYGLGLIGALLFFTWLFIMAVYRGKYEAEFVLDNKGILCRTQAKADNTSVEKVNSTPGRNEFTHQVEA